MDQQVSIGQIGDNVFNSEIPGKLKRIRVNFDKNGVYGLGFDHILGNGSIVSCKHNLAANGFTRLFQQELEFEIADGDDLLEINGRISQEGIHRLEFITYLGKNRNFGGKQGEYFQWKYPGFTFAGGFGSYNKKGYLQSMGFQLMTIPDWQMQNLRDSYMQNAEKVKIPF